MQIDLCYWFKNFRLREPILKVESWASEHVENIGNGLTTQRRPRSLKCWPLLKEENRGKSMNLAIQSLSITEIECNWATTKRMLNKQLNQWRTQDLKNPRNKTIIVLAKIQRDSYSRRTLVDWSLRYLLLPWLLLQVFMDFFVFHCAKVMNSQALSAALCGMRVKGISDLGTDANPRTMRYVGNEWELQKSC